MQSPYTDGEKSERVVAQELDLQSPFAVAVLHALREIVRNIRTVDPHFDEVRNAREHPSETEA
jgi:hypothetical protein